MKCAKGPQITNGAFPLHGTVPYGSLLGGFPLGTVPGTRYFFSTTSAEVPSNPYRYQNVTCKLYWSLIGRRKSSLLRHWACDKRPNNRHAQFKPAQPAKDRTQLLFEQVRPWNCNTSFRLTAEGLETLATFIGQGPSKRPYDWHVKQPIMFRFVPRHV